MRSKRLLWANGRSEDPSMDEQAVSAGLHAAPRLFPRRKGADPPKVKRRKSPLPGLLLLLLAVFLVFFLLGAALLPLFGFAFGDFPYLPYPADDRELYRAEETYSAWERDLSLRMEEDELHHPGFDRYVIEGDPIGHDPYALWALLSAEHPDGWTADALLPRLRLLFASAYVLTEEETTETRLRTIPVRLPQMVRDPDTGEVTYTTVLVQRSVWETDTVRRLTLQNNDLTLLAQQQLDEEARTLFTLYAQNKTGRPELCPSA